MKEIFTQLKLEINGDVHFDSLSKKIYSVDASIYEVEPSGIVIPKDLRDILTAVRTAFENNIPMIPRGAATGITGSCLGNGMILDTSKYLNKILEINIDEEYVICEPGVVQDRLNEALSPLGYRLGPDTSTGNRATLGGMAANNSAGARSLCYGKMSDHILEIELILSNGEMMICRSLDEKNWQRNSLQMNREGCIYKEVYRMANAYRTDIESHFPKIPRRVSGYNLDSLLLAPPLNLCSLIAGSEGSLGIISKIKLKIVKKPRHIGLSIIHVLDMIKEIHHIQAMLSHEPCALEMIDDKIIAMARLSPSVHEKLGWLKGIPQAVFIAEFEGSSESAVNDKLEKFSSHMHSLSVGYALTQLQDAEQISHVWDVRKAGLGLLLSKRSYSRAIAFIEDLSILPKKLPIFLAEFQNYLKILGKEAGIYGHIGSGCMHIRPYIDLRKKGELSLLQQIIEHVSDLVLAHGGALSGEHGDGLIRSWLNPKMFGKEIYQAFLDLKNAFDPENLMNPGKIVNGPPLIQNFRLSPETKQITFPTFLDFSLEGGFELAADLCNGNGQCRKMENVMCPSFQASGDEYDTTRARAQSLRAVIHGLLPFNESTENALHDVLDLCIECKGCKKECPSQVDMAKMKSEVLYQYQLKHGVSLRNFLFGHIHTLNRLASPFAKFYNSLSQSFFARNLFKWTGITNERALPHLAKETFSKWFYRQKQIKEERIVYLFNDTYTEFNQPEIGKAAYHVLKALGYQVNLIDRFCCGRPLISKGMLQQAKKNAEMLIQGLHRNIGQSTPIIVLEPSCASALSDDFQGLLGLDSPFKSLYDDLKELILTFEEFLQKELQTEKLLLNFKETQRDIFLHSHCHQKSLVTSKPSLRVLKAIPGFNVKEINSGCCGAAGAFGYEEEHYAFSMKIGELRLLPAVRNTPKSALIIASGFSCRHQIFHGTGRNALHLAEAINSQRR